MNSEFDSILRENLQNSIAAKQSFLSNAAQMDAFDRAAQLVVQSFKNGGRLYIAGNGGSAADAQHLAAEFVCKMEAPRAALPAEALSVDTSTLTAIGNDFGYDQVFVRQLEAKANPKDVFLAITTSGKSPNILKALEFCRAKGVSSVLFSGRDGGPAKALADISILANGANTSAIQEIHIVLCHSLCASVERAMF